LTRLIEESQEYVIKNDDYYLHIPVEVEASASQSIILNESAGQLPEFQPQSHLAAGSLQQSPLAMSPSSLEVKERRFSLTPKEMNLKLIEGLGAMTQKLSPGKRSLVIRRRTLNMTLFSSGENGSQLDGLDEGPLE